MSITPEDVKLQLMANLPRYTEEYGTNKTGVAVVSGGAVNITSEAHGLSSGDLIVGSEANVTIPVLSVSFNSLTGKATVTLDTDHDRTSGIEDNGGYNKATLQDFDDSNYNGEFTIISANEDDFIISSDADVSGALGNFIETRELYLGFSQVTVIDDDTFTIPVQDNLPNGVEFESFKFVSDLRIYIAADATRSVTNWGQHRDRKPSLFIIFGQENVSKDRNTQNDAAITANSQNSVRLKYIPQVTLKTVACTKTEQLAGTKVQQIHEEIKPAIRHSMYGTVFDIQDISQQYAAVEVHNSSEFWNQDNLLHNFDYEIPYEITMDQGDQYRRNVSFRNIILNAKMFNNEGDLVVVDADLEI